MPLLPRLPLPRRLTTDPPKPLAAGIGLALSLPQTAARLAATLPQTAIDTGLRVVARYEELAGIGTAAVAALAPGARDEADSDDGYASDDEDPYPAYGLDTAAWGGPEEPAPVPLGLPVADYDGLSAAALRTRLPGLSRADLTRLREYEQAHAGRASVLAMLDRAIARA